MRRCIKTLLVISLLAGITSSAWAVNLPGNVKIKMKFTNWDVGTLYDVADGTYTGQGTLDGLTQTHPVGSPLGEDAWGILRLESITNESGSVTYWNRFAPTTWNPVQTEITGIFWGEADTYLSQTTTGGTIVQEIHGVGMNVAFFEDVSLDFNNYSGVGNAEDRNGGPANRDVTGLPVWDLITNNGPGASSGPPVVRGGAGTIADSSPIWTVYSVPGFNQTYPTAEFFTTYSPNGYVAGSYNALGGFNANTGAVPYWGTGTDNWQWQTPGGTAMRFAFTGIDDDNHWIVMSDDPVLATTTPELSSGLLMLLGIVPIGLGWRRRRPA